MTLHSGTVNFDFPIIFRGPKISSFWSQNREKVEIEKSIKMRFFGSKIEIAKSRSKNRFAGLKKARFLIDFSNAGLNSSPAGLNLGKMMKFQSSKVDFLEISVQQPKKSKIQSSKMKFLKISLERSKNRMRGPKSDLRGPKNFCQNY